MGIFCLFSDSSHCKMQTFGNRKIIPAQIDSIIASDWALTIN